MTQLRTAIALSLIVFLSPLASASDTPLEKMRGHTEAMRNLVLGLVVVSSGSECDRITHSFVRGEVDGMVFVTVRCQNGDEYIIMEGEGENARIMTCAQSAAIMRGLGMPTSCWIPL